MCPQIQTIYRDPNIIKNPLLDYDIIMQEKNVIICRYKYAVIKNVKTEMLLVKTILITISIKGFQITG